MTRGIQINFWSRGCDSSCYRLVYYPYIGDFTVSNSDAVVLTRPRSHATAIHGYQKPLVWCRTVETWEVKILRRCDQRKLGSCRCW